MHQQLLATLDRYRKLYPAESEVARRIEQLVESHEDCLLRSCRPGHLTGGAWVLSHDRQRCVLVHHRKLNRWLQPGGHADGEADIAEVALREAREETGLESLHLLSPLPFDVDVHKIPARRDAHGRLLEDAHEHHDLRYLFVATENEEPQASEESHAARWFTRVEVRLHADDASLLRMLEKAGP